MGIECRTFYLVRRGNNPEEYEDAFAFDEATGRYALADGATESCFAALWAKLLVEQFAQRRVSDVDSWSASVPAIQAMWDADVCSREIAWHAEPSVAQGAFGTFLGVRLKPTRCFSYRWQAVAVGDTCLVHTRRDALLRAFPLDHPDQFGNEPCLVGSRMPLKDICHRARSWTRGRGKHGDRLWMMTDALAQWCLAEHAAGGNPWCQLESLLAAPEGDNGFAPWIEKLRDGGRLRNDDVTLVAIPL